MSLPLNKQIINSTCRFAKLIVLQVFINLRITNFKHSVYKERKYFIVIAQPNDITVAFFILLGRRFELEGGLTCLVLKHSNDINKWTLGMK